MSNSNWRNKLFTCRYWALGPKCHNVDAFGTVVCDFAHYDTGALASGVQQRGTCLAWKHYGFCGKGTGCWYEHRDTGVTGLYQGTVELTGFELEIADVATKAGFDTFRHESLFNLIWAVKRLALRGGGSQVRNLPPPPRDPIYPDRYRPSGIGDNTRKKRRNVTTQPQPNHNVELKFHPIKPLMRKRPLGDTNANNVIDLTADSDTEDLIDLSNPLEITSKRQKVTADGDPKPPASFNQQAPPSSRGVNTTATSAVPLARGLSRSQRKAANRRARQVQGVRFVDAAAGRGIPLTAANAVPIVPKRPLTTSSAVPVVPTRPLTAEQEITKQLLLVKTKLEDARKNMNTCQATMKALYDTHYNTFDNEETMIALQKLSNNMNKVYDGGKEGASEIDKAIGLLNDNKDGIL